MRNVASRPGIQKNLVVGIVFVIAIGKTRDDGNNMAARLIDKEKIVGITLITPAFIQNTKGANNYGKDRLISRQTSKRRMLFRLAPRTRTNVLMRRRRIL